MSDEMIWQDPRPSAFDRRRMNNWHEVASALRARPGQWALVAKATTVPQATHIRQGKLVAFRPAGSFEATTRSVGRSASGRPLHDVYARYVGGEDR